MEPAKLAGILGRDVAPGKFDGENQVSFDQLIGQCTFYG